MKTKICITCQKVYEQPKNQRGKIWASRKYCSHNCMPAWNKGMKGLILNRNFFDNNPTLRGKGTRLHWNWPTGERNHKYISDRTKLKKNDERNDMAYKEWRKNVWTRDNFKCKIANDDCNGRIEAHHILGWTAHPELRYIPNNGITLCHFHHPRKKSEESRLIPTFKELINITS